MNVAHCVVLKEINVKHAQIRQRLWTQFTFESKSITCLYSRSGTHHCWILLKFTSCLYISTICFFVHASSRGRPEDHVLLRNSSLWNDNIIIGRVGRVWTQLRDPSRRPGEWLWAGGEAPVHHVQTADVRQLASHLVLLLQGIHYTLPGVRLS